MFDDWRLMGSMLAARDEHARWQEGHYPEDHEGAPGASPTWFVIAFVLVLICCGLSAFGALIAWLAGAFS